EPEDKRLPLEMTGELRLVVTATVRQPLDVLTELGPRLYAAQLLAAQLFAARCALPKVSKTCPNGLRIRRPLPPNIQGRDVSSPAAGREIAGDSDVCTIWAGTGLAGLAGRLSPPLVGSFTTRAKQKRPVHRCQKVQRVRVSRTH